MKPTRLIPIVPVVAAVLAVGGVAGTAPTAWAQTDASTVDSTPISLNFQGAPVQSALESLFKSVHLNHVIDSDVQGSVTISLNNVSFDVALRTLLRTASPPLKFDIQDGIYHIRVKATATPESTTPSNPFASGPGTGDPSASTTGSSGTQSTDLGWYKLPIDHWDAYYIAQLALDKGQLTQVVVSQGVAPQGGGGVGGGAGGIGGGLGSSGSSFGNTNSFGSSNQFNGGGGGFQGGGFQSGGGFGRSY